MGSFGVLEGNITGRREKKKKKKQNTHITATPREVAQILASTTGKRGLNREAWVACLG